MAMRVSGFLGWIHRMVMLITFPIRKFWLIVAVLLVVLAILIAIPMFYGIRFGDIWDWYMVKMPNHEFVAAKDKKLFETQEQIDKLRKTFKEIIPNKKAAAAKDEKEDKKSSQNQLVSWHVAEFRKAKYKPHAPSPIVEKIKEIKEIIAETPATEDNAPVEEYRYVEETQQIEEPVTVEEALPEENNAPVVETSVVEAEYNITSDTPSVVTPEPVAENENVLVVDTVENTPEYHVPSYVGNIENYYTKIRSADLAYLDVPEIFEGDVRVIGPNSLYVGDDFVFLYGIYSHPRRHDIKAATGYLQNITQGRRVYCIAVAYSRKTSSPTALCFVNGVLINKSLTEHNLAKNVALK
jgi:hypothetical protein